MEAKASKHASKCEHACARSRVCVCERVRVRARSLMATLPGGGPADRTGANSAAMRAGGGRGGGGKESDIDKLISGDPASRGIEESADVLVEVR